MPQADRRRLVVLGGARQTGKTTLAQRVYPDLRYLNLDDLDLRESVRGIRARSWADDVGPAIVDEAQKEPSVLEKIKYSFDAREIDFTIVLGSSRILLLKQVRESLAGRAFVFDLWPLMAAELASLAGDPEPPLLDAMLRSSESLSHILDDVPGVDLSARDEARRKAVEHLLAWGGMPELLGLDDSERREWLRSYDITYLERDLGDLARLDDLAPFRRFQQLAALRTGALLSYADLARDAGVSPATARRYLEYLRLSYQAVLLPPFATNLTSALVKSPKLYWTDVGLARQQSGIWGNDGGQLLETLVVGECDKWIQTAGLRARLSFYRTRSGMELDLLVEHDERVLGIEVKSRDQVVSKDLRAMRAIAEALGDRWQGGIVAYRGRRIEELDPDWALWAIPVHRLVG